MNKTNTVAKSRPRTYARNRRAISRKGNELTQERDSAYFLKLVVFTILGTFWIKFGDPYVWMGLQFNAIPVGLLLGLLLVSKYEKIQFDRKIWYAVLIIVAIVSYFTPSGVVI